MRSLLAGLWSGLKDGCRRRLAWWRRSLDDDVESAGEDGVSLCIELVTAEFVAAGALLGVEFLKGQEVQAPARWAFLIISLCVLFALLTVLVLPSGRHQLQASAMKHYFKRGTRQVAVWCVLIVAGLGWFGSFGGLSRAFGADSPATIVDVNRFVFTDMTVGVQVVVSLDPEKATHAPDGPTSLRVKMSDAIVQKWQINHGSTGFIGSPGIIAPLLQAEEVRRQERIASGNLDSEAFRKLIHEQRFLDPELREAELGNWTSPNKEVRGTFNPSFPPESDSAAEFDVFLGRLPSAGPLVFQFRLYPRKPTEAGPTDEDLLALKQGGAFSVTPVPTQE